MLHLLMGVRPNGETDGIRLLRLMLNRYAVRANLYSLEYCYDGQPPSKIADRKELCEDARSRLEAEWLEVPGVIIGFGWLPCELLTGRGKTKLKNMTGTRWNYIGNIVRTAWVTYDPAACLYDPAVAVDIASVIVAAGKEAELPMTLAVDNGIVSQMNNIWKRYL